MAQTMTSMNASLSSLRFDRSAPSLSMVKFLQARAALPEMPERESHVSAFTGVAIRLAAAAVPVTALAWLAVAG